MTRRRNSLTMDDGTSLSYLERGDGPVLLMLPGLAGSAERFTKQLDGLGDDFRVIAFDTRGQGESDKPLRGYTYPRLARDLACIVDRLELDDVTLLGHSAGCKIIWTYFELYDGAKVGRLVLSDDAPAPVLDGAFTFDEAIRDVEQINGPNAEAYSAEFGEQFLTPDADKETRALFTRERLKLPRAAHQKLLRWALFGDWWDALTLINVPTLVIGGRLSKNPWQNVQRIHETIAGSELYVFEADEGGAHAMYWENPSRYNQLLRDFIHQHVLAS